MLFRVVTRTLPTFSPAPYWVAEVDHFQAVAEGDSKEAALVGLRLALAGALQAVDKALESK